MNLEALVHDKLTTVLAYVLAANPSAAKKLSCSTLCLIEIMTMRVNLAIEKIKIKFDTTEKEKKKVVHSDKIILEDQVKNTSILKL